MGHLLATSSGAVLVLIPLYIILYIVFSLGVYGTYKKAGANADPAWAAFIPIYNFYVMLKMVGRPGWWTWLILLPIIPLIGSIAFLVIAIIVLHDVSKSFGHGGGFTVGLVLLSVIFWYILWLGSSTYRGPSAKGGGYGGGGYGGGYGADPAYPPQPGYQPGYAPQPGYPPPAPPSYPPPAPPSYPPPAPPSSPPPAPPSYPPPPAPGAFPPPPGNMPPPQ